MEDNKGSKKNNSKYEVKTSMSCQTYEFKWAVENFPKWPDTFEEKSEEFQPAQDIILYAKFVGDGVNCHLKFISKDMIPFQLKLNLSIVDSDGKKVHDGTVRTLTYGDIFQEQIYSYTISHKKMIEISDSTKDHIVIFQSVFEISALTTKNAYMHLPQSSSDLLPTIIEDFRSMFSDSLYTDVTLSVGNNVLEVHKSVLCARSPVFAKMLKSPMDEKEKDVITISDIDLPILKTFIEFLYSGDMPDADFETACALYYAADKYEVPSLQKECANVLLEKLDVENSCQVLALAKRHSDVELIKLVLCFMLSEFDALVVTDSWMDFVRVETDLAVKIMELNTKKLG